MFKTFGMIVGMGVILGGGCAATGASDSDLAVTLMTPADWVPVTSKCGFAFRAPPDIRETQVQPQDSCVVDYDADGCNYGGDYGAYSGGVTGFSNEAGYQLQNERIDGLDATIVTYGPIEDAAPYGAAIHFPSIPSGPAGIGTKLTFVARCASQAAQTSALLLYRTLSFP